MGQGVDARDVTHYNVWIPEALSVDVGDNDNC